MFVTNKNRRVWVDFLKVNYLNNISKILFYPFIGCGYANKIPTLVSSLLLSLVSYHPIYIVNWHQLMLYFHFPKFLFIQNYNLFNTVVFNRKNSSILNLLRRNISIKIFTYHSFTSSVLYYYNLSNHLKLLMKEKQYKNMNLDNILSLIFLKPKDNINKHLKKFKKISKRDYILGIHIRTGYLSDFGEKARIFFSNKSISLYIKNINRIINKYKKYKLYIISDSTLIKEYFTTLYKHRVLKFSIPGKICHAKDGMHGKKELNECVVKLIAENYVLSECNILIGSKRSTYFGMACSRGVSKCIKI